MSSNRQAFSRKSFQDHSEDCGGNIPGEIQWSLNAIVTGLGRLRFLVRPRCSGFVGLMMADHAAGNRPNLSMSRDVPGNAADDRPLDASLRLGGGRKRDAQGGDADDESLHDDFLAFSFPDNSPWRVWFHCVALNAKARL
jgi:hypothetical protein